MVLYSSYESTEGTGITECALLDLLEDAGEIRINGVRTVVVCVTEVFNIFGEVTEQEDVVLSDFTGDFNLLLLAKTPKMKRLNLR